MITYIKKYLQSHFVLILSVTCCLNASLLQGANPSNLVRNTTKITTADHSRIFNYLKSLGNEKENLTEPRLFTVCSIDTPKLFSGWCFFRIEYIPALPKAGNASAPLLDALIAIKGDKENFYMQHWGDIYTKFNEFLKYNSVKIQDSDDLQNVLSAFSELFGRKFSQVPPVFENEHYIATLDNGDKISIGIKSDKSIASFKIFRKKEEK